MMNNILYNARIQAGDTLIKHETGESYSVVYVDPDKNKISVFLKGTTRLVGHEWNTDVVLADCIKGKITVIHDDDEPYYCPEGDDKTYLLRRSIIEKLKPVYGPSYQGLIGKNPKPIIRKIMAEFDVSKTTVLAAARKYVQSGGKDSSLHRVINRERNLDPTRHYLRRGRSNIDPEMQSEITITPEIEKIFDKYRGYLLKSQELTVTEAYVQMLCSHFSKVVFIDDDHYYVELLPPSDIPTLKQFRDWYNKHTSKQERLKAKIGDAAYNNNHRTLTSDTRTDAICPGRIAECDHFEMPFSIVSSITKNVISKPILAAMVDSFCGIPFSYSLSLDNNSIRACSHLVSMLAKSKVEYCKLFDVQLQDESEWPGNLLPSELRFDNGNDFLSEYLRNYCEQNGIDYDYVRRASGSLKPNVERFFMTLKQWLIAYFERHGLITKTMLPNQKPHLHAAVDEIELERLICHFCVQYIRTIKQKFKPTKDMLKKGIEASPIGLYYYGVQKWGSPHPIPDLKYYYYSVLVEETAKYDRSGIHLNKLLVYQDKRDIKLKKLHTLMEEAGDNLVPITVRYDPRDVSYVYVHFDDKILCIPLKNTSSARSFRKCTMFQIEELIKLSNKARRDAIYHNIKLRVSFSAVATDTINVAVAYQMYQVDDKHIKEERKYAKEEIAKKHAVTEDLNKLLQAEEENEGSEYLQDTAPFLTIEVTPCSSETKPASVDDISDFDRMRLNREQSILNNLEKRRNG